MSWSFVQCGNQIKLTCLVKLGYSLHLLWKVVPLPFATRHTRKFFLTVLQRNQAWKFHILKVYLIYKRCLAMEWMCGMVKVLDLESGKVIKATNGVHAQITPDLNFYEPLRLSCLLILFLYMYIMSWLKMDILWNSPFKLITLSFWQYTASLIFTAFPP